MKTNWLPLNSIPATGSSVSIDDQDFWLSAMAEFAIACKILEPIVAKINILPGEDGILFRGQILGKISLPCNRCAADSIVVLNQKFTSYEHLPKDPYVIGKNEDVPEEELAIDDAVVRNVLHGRGIEINPSALAWEEFSLALPVKPLCTVTCKGLCPICGCDKNTETCDCEKEVKDPRLAALHGLVIKKG